MVGIVLLALFAEGQEMQPVQYSMILPGIVMDETIEADADWMGLFRADSGNFMMRPVELQLVQQQGIVYEGERPLGRIVELPAETERPVILVSSSMPVFPAGPVETLIEDRLPLLPCDAYELGSSSIETVELEVTEDGLYISAPGIRQEVTDTYPGIGPEGPYIDIVWAGDLDGDGRLDLLINDVENSYLIYKWELYLSTEASRGQLVGFVASFFDVFY
jgi:hypothetical protein